MINNNPPTSSFGLVNACPDAAALDMQCEQQPYRPTLLMDQIPDITLLTPGTYLVQIATAGSSTFLVTENVTMSRA